MFRKTTLLIGALTLMLVAPQAHAAAGEWTIGLNGGVASPLGDFKTDAKLGFLGGVSFDYMATENLAIGADGSFISNKGSASYNAKLTTGNAGSATTVKSAMINGGAHAKYMFPMASESSISPYVVGGVGIYNVKNTVESGIPAYNTAQEALLNLGSKVGARGGLGFMYKTSEKVGIGVEGNFHWINNKQDATTTSAARSATQFFGVQAGVTIGMGTPGQ